MMAGSTTTSVSSSASQTTGSTSKQLEPSMSATEPDVASSSQADSKPSKGQRTISFDAPERRETIEDELEDQSEDEDHVTPRFHQSVYPQVSGRSLHSTPVVGGPTIDGGCFDRSSAVAMQVVWKQNLTCLFFICSTELRNLLLSKFRTLVLAYTNQEVMSKVTPTSIASHICRLYFVLRCFLFRRFKTGTPPDIAYSRAVSFHREKGQSPAQFLVVLQDLLIEAREADGGRGLPSSFEYYLAWRSLSLKEEAKYKESMEDEETVAALLAFWEDKEKDFCAPWNGLYRDGRGGFYAKGDSAKRATGDGYRQSNSDSSLWRVKSRRVHAIIERWSQSVFLFLFELLIVLEVPKHLRRNRSENQI